MKPRVHPLFSVIQHHEGHAPEVLPRQTIKRVAPGLDLLTQYERREVFGYDSPTLGKVTFDVTGLKRAIARKAIVFYPQTILLDEILYRNVMEDRGVEEAHIAEIRPEDLETPGIGLLTPKIANPQTRDDFWTLTVDGNHRLARRYREGFRTAPMNLLPRRSWQPFMARGDAEIEQFFLRNDAPGEGR